MSHHLPPSSLPEPLRLGRQVWLVVLLVEVLSQLFTLTVQLTHPAVLATLVQESNQAGELSENAQLWAARFAVIVATLVSLAILGFAAFALQRIRIPGKKSRNYRLLLGYFAGFFAFRGMLQFASPAAAVSLVPLQYTVVQGALEILVGVLAVTGAILLYRKEVTAYIDGEDGTTDASHGTSPHQR
ncbi:hypothetical protein ACFPVT_04585 [Corynebacterium choanae]|uniref:Uncharacterized protein n=1 Tax=Corynebacterium choanae TaxID=1862358 RepID=A0A3G6J8T5_9CORY|nr:hypothetical protein [Corynebacterium choanae]AZA14477.1 hypothetical protein CCHOA_10490 [Corynebacterium choanae]